MSLNLEGLELTDDQMAKINSQNEGLKNEEQVNEQLAGIKANRDQLRLDQQKAKDNQAAAEAKTEEERITHLQETKNFKELSESYKTKLDEQEQANKANAEKAGRLTLKNKAVEIAGTIAEGHNAGLLAEFIGRRLRMDGDEIKVTDKAGQLTISTVEDLVTEFKADEKFASLISATKASGGKGGEGGEITRKEIKSNTVGGVDMGKHKDAIAERLAKQGVR